MARLIDDMLVLTNGGTGRWELQLQPLVPEDISMSVYEKFVPHFCTESAGTDLAAAGYGTAICFCG